MRRYRSTGAALRLCILLTVGVLGCHPSVTSVAEPAGPAPWFEDVTEQSGLQFRHEAGPTGSYFMPQIAGSGGAFFDFDNDGRLDIYLLQNGGPSSKATNRLFRQGKDGRFTDVSAGSGLDVAGYSMGVAIGDVNNDGFPDVLVTQYTGVRLFLNNGNGTFTDVTKESGLENAAWGTSAAFFDFDRDGLLDLVVVNYVDYDPTFHCASAGKEDFCAPASFTGSVTRLFRNRGPGANGERVRFEDVTLKSGLGRVPGPGLGVYCADFDGDGWPDVFVANDGQPNRLWINQKDGTFKEEAVARGLAYNNMGQAQANMGVAVGDVDGDGLLDVFVTHLTWETHTLWIQGPRGTFRDRTAAAGLLKGAWRSTGFGTVLADFDHDGWPDLVLANGRITRGAAASNSALGPFWGIYAERNQLFANDGTGRFRDISAANAPLCGTPSVSRGLIYGDFDEDGAVDLLVTNIAAPARLLRNVVPNRGHWLLVRAMDPGLKRDAYGAEITVTAAGRRRVGWLNPASSYLCSNDPRVHFGLGPAEHVEALRVRWPDGTDEEFPGRKADQVVILRKGEGEKVALPAGKGR